MKKNIILIIILFSIIGAFSSFIFINSPFLNKEGLGVVSLENKIINISEKSSPSIVSIIEEKDLDIYKNNKWGFFDNKVGGGTGFFVNKDGIIITNNHVVKNKNSKYIIILNNGKEFKAKIIYSDKKEDIALLKVLSTEGFSPLNIIPLNFIEKNNNLKIGQFVIAIGNTLSKFNNSVSFGIISGLNRKIENNYINLENLIQTDANINPGNSGGPLINLKGEVIGINTLIINSNQNIGFAIKINKYKINEILEQIKR
ncbi:MAG: trypsin-like peptidase domain-containing protein [Candidatus Gracilibacteria bacterium]|nr:trypsin-like peptidase domain-containing protein [Candidatus Gracilibacteria bacterium]